MKRLIFAHITDIILVFFSYCFIAFLKYNSTGPIFDTPKTIVVYLMLWSVISVMFGKYNFHKFINLRHFVSAVSLSNLVFLALAVILIRVFKPFVDFRFIILYSIFLATAFEFLVGYILITFAKALESNYLDEQSSQSDFEIPLKETPKQDSLPFLRDDIRMSPTFDITRWQPLLSTIEEETDKKTVQFIKRFISVDLQDTLVLSTTTPFNVYNQVHSDFKLFINLKRVNDFQYINKFFEAANKKLIQGGLFICWVETYKQRKKRILEKYPWGINYLFYMIDFFIKRVLPKLNFTKQFYFFLTRGQNRVISKAETYGRLYSCGFEFVEETLINDRLFFAFRKTKKPAYDTHPTYGPIIKLKRLGQNGKIIGVFKLRTMHAFSEYLQDFVYKNHALAEGGKFKDDFRISTLGRLLRSLWIDELPMLLNVIIFRNMKIVGVRPLSQHYFSLYNPEVQEKRLKHKPGLIPPFYAEFPTPKTLQEIMANEMHYLEKYEKAPFKTDAIYFFKAFYNIIIKKARSK